MKRRILPAGLLLIIVVLIGAALYGNGNYVVYMLTYIFSFVFLLCFAVFAASTVLEKNCSDCCVCTHFGGANTVCRIGYASCRRNRTIL